MLITPVEGAVSSAPFEPVTTMSPALDKLTHGGFSIGIELPLDNDWSPAGDAKRLRDGRRHGVPDLEHHATLAKLADSLGFRALWVRDVPVYDPAFGDAAQVFEVFSYLGYRRPLAETFAEIAAEVLRTFQPSALEYTA